MGQRKIRHWIFSGVAVAVLLLAAAGTAPASTSGQTCANAAPCNDNYLNSLELNAAGTRLNRIRTLEDFRNTSTATTQGNLFNPCGQSTCPSGPAELTSCAGVSYGNTVWYDFYPDRGGTVSIRTSAFFRNVITLYAFDNNPRTANFLVPVREHCIASTFGSAQLVAPVKKGVAYTFQIGGADTSQAPSGTGGQLQMQLDFFPTPPRRLSASATLTARATSNGIELLSLAVSTARAAKVALACGGFCSPQSKSDHATETFPGLNGVRMPSGSNLTIRVTAPHSIGVFIQYHVTRGGFSKHTFCTEPGSRKPRTKCH